MIVYRVGNGRYRMDDPEGSSRYGGRWNDIGIPVIYAAESRALAALETLVNSNKLSNNYVCVQVEIPDELSIVRLELGDMPPGWNAPSVTDSTRQIGSNWVLSQKSVTLSVPSAVIPEERNFILNPAHPEFKRINFSVPKPFSFDRRIQEAGWRREGATDLEEERWLLRQLRQSAMPEE